MKTVACVIQDGFAPFEFGVACEAFGLDRADDGVPNFDFRIVAPRAGVVTSKIGFSVNVEHDLAFAYEADLVVFCPLPRERWGDIDPLLLDVARHAVDRGAWVMSVCSGSFILAAAGVLDGRRATTHWMYAPTLAKRYPSVHVDPRELFVDDGDVLTSAGTAAGIDLCLALVEDDLGRAIALEVARHLVVFLKRPGGQSQFSVTLSLQKSDRRFAELHAWIAENLTLDLSIATLAAQAGMSERSFVRHYRTETGQTPARAVELIRVENARRQLADSTTSIKRIAMQCGFGCEETLRRSFLRALSVTPQAYRERFSPLQ